jgi:Killing trait
VADDSAANASSAANRSQHSLRDFFARIEAGLGEAAANAVVAQQQAWVAAQARQTQLALLYDLETAALAESVNEELVKG